MSKSQNTKSEQLTEQWKKGELQSGWYWVELKEGTFVDGKKSIILDYLFEFTNDFERYPYLVEQVLAPVPPYEVYKELIDGRKLLREHIKDTTKENAKLKELLMQSRIYVKIDTEDYEDRTVSKAEKAEARKLLTKIDEALR